MEHNKTPLQLIRYTFLEKTLTIASTKISTEPVRCEYPISGFVFLSQHNTLLWVMITKLYTSSPPQQVFPPLPSLLAPSYGHADLLQEAWPPHKIL